VENRTRDLPACSVVPQPTAFPRRVFHESKLRETNPPEITEFCPINIHADRNPKPAISEYFYLPHVKNIFATARAEHKMAPPPFISDGSRVYCGDIRTIRTALQLSQSVSVF
jgi:hypothetical protein